MKPVLVSGIKPSGTLHIGNYLGALKNFVALQNSGAHECFFFIADYHSLTERYLPKEKKKQILDVILDYRAAGLDPKKSTLFIQSHVPEHANLAWIFNCLTSMGELERMVEYKEKVVDGQVPNAGLFDYPVLMAADILIYKASLVPVGEDQRQHVELARTVARAFNKRFGSIFPEPKMLYTQTPRVMDLADPKRKMSKSLPKGCLFLADSPKIIREKVAAAVTDSARSIEYAPDMRPGISNLVLIYSEFSDKPKEAVVEEFRDAGYAKFKEALADLIIEKLKPFQARRKELKNAPEVVLRDAVECGKRAQAIAAATLAEAKRKVGLL